MTELIEMDELELVRNKTLMFLILLVTELALT